LQYRTLGVSGIQVNALSLGTWQTVGQSLDFDQSERLIRYAYEQGINMFDAADTYGDAEQCLGQILAALPRERCIIATKCFFPTAQKPDSKGLSRRHLITSVDLSRKKLRMDTIDLFQCHRFDPDTPLEETVSTLQSLIEQKKIAQWGICRWEAHQLRAVHALCRDNGWKQPVSDQHFYNLLHREIEGEILPACNELGLGMIVYSPLAQGVLTGKYADGIPASSRAAQEATRKTMWDLNEQSLDYVRKLKHTCDTYNVTMPQLALAFCLRPPGVSTVLCGAISPEQLQDNLGALSLVMEEELWKNL
jgi:aryl-alcohol dehydrogenase-like predicted oxidoreductase